MRHWPACGHRGEVHYRLIPNLTRKHSSVGHCGLMPVRVLPHPLFRFTHPLATRPDCFTVYQDTARMDADEISRLWATNKHRPAFVREHADEIEQHTEIDEAIPDTTLAAVAEWCNRHAGTVDDQLPEPGETADDNGVIQ